jgi:redox-sensitive bicupin YhaK (pirin superfamily)
VNATYLDIEISPWHAWSYSTVPSDTLFIYILSGIGTFDEDKAEIANKHATLFTSGEILNVCASEKGIRFLLLSASPLLEPIAWGWPIVMNTTTELEQAFQELNQWTFIKKNDE